MNNLRVNEITLVLDNRILDDLVVPHIKNCISCLRINDSVLLLKDEDQKLEMARTVCVHAILEVLEDNIGRIKDRAKPKARRKK